MTIPNDILLARADVILPPPKNSLSALTWHEKDKRLALLLLTIQSLGVTFKAYPPSFLPFITMTRSCLLAAALLAIATSADAFTSTFQADRRKSVAKFRSGHFFAHRPLIYFSLLTLPQFPNLP